MNYLRSLFCLLFAPLLVLLSSFSLSAAPASITVEVSHPGHAISPTLYGIFFEDINCSADGGLYAEMVRNRNFEDSDKPQHWSTQSSGAAAVAITIDSSRPESSKNLRSLDRKSTRLNSSHEWIS